LASVITGAGVWSLTRSTPAPPAPVQRFPITIPASAPYIGEAGGEIVISPDGTRLVYPAFEGGKRVLYMRNLDQLEAQPLRGTDDAISPFFSPDGEWVGFFTAPGTPAGKLKKVPAGGGPPITIADADIPTGTWAAGNTIVFTRSPGGPIWRLWKVPAAGGTAAALTTVDLRVKELKHSWPDALPDGKNVLFTVTTGPFFNESHVAVLSLATGAYRTVIDEGYHARYVPSGHGADGRGHIIYALAGNLMAVPFDPGRLETTGPPVPVVEGIRGRTDSGVAGFAVSRTGFLVYSPGTTVATTQRTMVWVDRQGHEEAISAPSRTYTYPRLSPDGARVALDIRDQENDIWIWDLARKSLSRLTFDPAIDSFPVWSPDGRRIAFSSARGGASNLFWQAADGTGQAERLSESPNPQGPQSFSPDGRQLLYRENDPKTNADINLLSLDLSRQVKPLIKTPFSEQNAELSPDGKFVAYQSNESGRDEIYVRPFPDADRGRWQVSTLGGTRPLWAHSGRELFYLAGESARMMAVAVQTGPSFTAGSPQILFDGPYLAASNNSGRTYDVSLDDKRFLMIKTASDASPTAPSSLVAVINWFDELRRVAPPKR
jgi:serine/threonine-protein kinase